MTDVSRPEDTAARLRFALQEGHLQGALACAGETVLTHLTKPTQITAIGYPLAGKTSLLNMILGGTDMPDLPRVPLVELRYGSAPRFRFRAEGQAEVSRPGIATADALPASTVWLAQELPRGPLRTQSLTEINLPEDSAALRHVLDWLIEMTDITLWCTQSFDTREAEVWAQIPDGLKDNSFMVLTKADRLQMTGKLDVQTARFETSFADDFLCLYPVATKQASAARATGAVTDPQLWSASGGRALLNALTRQIDSGKSADLDYAEMLLAQVCTPMPDTLPVSSPAPATPKNAGAGEKPAAGTTSGTSRSDLSAMSRVEALETALQILQDCAESMCTPSEHGTETHPQSVLTRSAEAAQALGALLMDVGQDDSVLRTLRDDVLESEQLILLLQLEGTKTAAADAVTALLQLKKDVAEVAFA